MPWAQSAATLMTLHCTEHEEIIDIVGQDPMAGKDS
jgi:hypothetical protein